MARHNKVKVLHVAEDDLDHLSDQWWELTSYKADLEHVSNMDPLALWIAIGHTKVDRNCRRRLKVKLSTKHAVLSQYVY